MEVEVCRELAHQGVVRGVTGVHSLQAQCSCRLHQVVHQQRAQSLVLPGVGYHDSELALMRAGGGAETADPDLFVLRAVINDRDIRDFIQRVDHRELVQQ